VTAFVTGVKIYSNLSVKQGNSDPDEGFPTRFTCAHDKIAGLRHILSFPESFRGIFLRHPD